MNDIAEKIAKLIAKADSSTHPEEADTFMSKAHALMMAHGLSLLDLGRLDSEDPIGHTEADHLRANSNAAWRTTVANQLAKYFGCRLIADKRGTFTYWVVFGRESARVTFSLMWPYVDRQILSEARAEFRKGNFKSTKQAHGAVGHAMAVRLMQMVKDRDPKEAGEGKGLNALVPVDLIEQEVMNRFPALRKGRGRARALSSAAWDAANRINLNQQMGGKSGSKMIGVA